MKYSSLRHFIKKVVLLLLVFILPVSLFAVDFGLVTSVFAATDNSRIDKDSKLDPVDFRVDFFPRLSFFTGNNSEMIISAGFSIANEDPNFVPELLRTEFSARFGNSGIRLGRFNYSDPLSFIASGLFDGLQFYNNSMAGRFGAGVWYTGLQYRKQNEITMTKNDEEIFFTPFDFDNFADTYFAPQRMFAALEWSHPSIGELLSLNITGIGQFDFADKDQYNNQYFILKAGIPVNSLLIELGGALEFSQIDDQLNMSYAGLFGFSWMLPTSFSSRLSLTGRIAGSNTSNEDDLFNAFTPITTKYYGNIIKEKMSGLSVISLDYSARLGDTIGMNLNASYFIRDDGKDLSDVPELFARLIWSPVSDVQFNFGGGAAFLSQTDGSVKTEWRVELSAVLSLF